MTRTKLSLPKKLTAFARPKSLGENKEAFMAANLIKGESEEVIPEFDGTVNSYFELTVEIRSLEIITADMVKKWIQQLGVLLGPDVTMSFVRSTLARMLGYEKYHHLESQIKNFNGKLPNKKFQKPSPDLVGKNNSFYDNKVLKVTVEFINQKPGVIHQGECYGKYNVDSVFAVLDLIIKACNSKTGPTFNHVNFRTLANMVYSGCDYTVSRDWCHDYVAKLLGYQSYEEIKNLLVTSTTRLEFGRSPQDYVALKQKLIAL